MPLSARSARHARPTKRSTRAVAASLGVALAATSLVATASQSAQANECVLVPVLRDATVSQGIGKSATTGGYATLVRGKTTVVKAYLSKPSCAAPGDRVKITAASLQVTFDNIAAPDPLLNTITGPVFPELLDHAAAPATDAASDPTFAVPGSLLDGPRKDRRVAATFTMIVNYEATSESGILSVGTATLRPAGSLTAPTASATFERASNSPRLLVAVMGDPTKGFTHNWPARTDPAVADGAEDALLRALQAASRIGPFKDGVVKDINGSLGIRYTVAPTVVDVRSAIRADGKFCGTSTNFSDLRAQLSSFLNNWQTANEDTVVDKVLGVVWGPNSTGPETDTTCADGYAAIGGNQAWTRLTPDSSSGVSNAGNLIVMETVGHNFGSVPVTRDDDNDAYHSAAGAGAGSRGFHTTSVNPMVDPAPVSPLKYSITGWDDNKTLLRVPDWQYTLCRLTPETTDKCPVDSIDTQSNTEPIGAAAAVAQAVYTLAGTTDGTAAGTNIDTYLSSDTDVTEPSATSEYHLVQRGIDGSSEPILSSTSFPVDFRTSEHHTEGEHEHPTSSIGTLEVRFAAAPGAQIFEVYKGDPELTAPIYRRQRDSAPVVGATSLTPGLGRFVNETADTEHGASLPALSPDGSLLAYATATGGVVVKNLETGAVSEPVVASAVSWVDGDTVALVREGSLYVRDVTGSTKPALTNERTVYDSTKQVELFFAPAGRPTADEAGTHLVTSIAGDLWRIDLEQALLSPSGVVCKLAANSLAPCYQLTTGQEQDTEPAYESSTRVLFTRDGAIRAFDIGTGRVEQASIPAAGEASASTPFVAYTSETGLGLADAATLTVQKAALTTGADSAPSLVGRDLAFARETGSRTDVFTSRMQTNTLTFEASDEDPARLRAGVYATCDGINYPIFVAVPPSTVSADVARWTLEWDAAGSPCTAPELYAVINDGIDTVRADLGTAYGPEQPPLGTVGAIYSPAPGSTVRQYDVEALLGDVPGVPADELSWQVTGPGVDLTLSFVRGEPTLVFPPSGGWTDGAVYAVMLQHGEKTLATGAFTAVADQDHDNIPKTVEERCFGNLADLDPTNASRDDDADGEPNVSDVDPCGSSVNVTVDLDANSLKTTSNGSTVTLYLSASGVDLRTVPLDAIAATRIGNYDAHLPAVSLREVTATSATVKLDRQQLQTFVEALGLTGYVPVILTGSGSAGSFRGFDPTDPTFS